MNDLNNRFSEARIKVLGESSKSGGIGTLSEKSTHKILKLYLEPDESCHEIKINGSVADVFNSDGIYEIQTHAAERLLPKLEKFLPENKVTVVIPVASERTVFWIDRESGEISPPRKSPRRESVYTACRELYKIRRYLNHKNIRVKLVLFTASVYKYLDGWDRTKKRGATKIESIPTSFVAECNFASPRDYAALIPDTLNDTFTAKEFAKAARFSPKISSFITGLLREVGVIETVGKDGRAYLYKVK